MDVLELWNKFDTVSVGASLDAEGERAELMRKGTVWKDIVENRKRMIEICPKVDFYISATVGLINALHVVDFHRSWADQGLIKPMDFNFNLLQWPKWQRMDNLPQEYKQQVDKKYKEHIQWLKDKDPLTRATKGYQSALNWMWMKDNTKNLPLFFEQTRKYDTIRQENILAVFPELKELFDKHEKN